MRRIPILAPRKHPCHSVSALLSAGFALLALLGAVTGPALAGDLLRGGGFSAPASGSGVPGSFTPPSAALARKNASDALARTTLAIQSVNALQNQARAIALQAGNTLGIANPNKPSAKLPTVTDGVSLAGLYPAAANYPTGGPAPAANSQGALPLPQSWSGISAFGETESGSKTNVTVTQDSQFSYLSWVSFNVGVHTTLDFDQAKGGNDQTKWVAFNVIQDPSLAPSQILGSIIGGGQVYVINQNGIIFGGASQINLHTLVASSLPINTNLAGTATQQGLGLLDNPGNQFLFSALAEPAVGTAAQAFKPPASLLPGNVDGNITVQAGAQISAPASADHVGGRIALIGPNVINDGSISTPDGQTILAAGLQVGFSPSSATTLRGLNVYVGAISDPSYNSGSLTSAGIATNRGLISVPEGDATITGQTVSQLGVIDSTTSVSLNGEIDLLASYGAVGSSSSSSSGNAAFLYSATGNVLLGPGSASDILPELDSGLTAARSLQLLPSTVNIQGQSLHMAGNAALVAPDANINISVGFWSTATGGSQSFEYSSTATSNPQVYLDSGALIYAAGSANVAASVDQNIIAVQLRGAEFDDDPSQRLGVLRGQTVYVDVRQQGVYNGFAWIGTPLADIYGYYNLIQQTIGEFTIDGGSVNIESGGSVVMQPGSQINVSGGYINYAGGIVDTTKLLSNGHIYDISQAYPYMSYDGIFTGQFTQDHPKYALQETYTDPIPAAGAYQQGYIYGGSGGTLTITSPATALDGSLLGVTASGPRQRQLQAQPSTYDLVLTGNNGATNTTITGPTVYISNATQPPAAPFALNSSGNPEPISADRVSTVVLSPDLTDADGFNIFSVNDSDGRIIVPAGVTWKDAPVIYADPATGSTVSSSISLSAADADVEGSIDAPGGSITFKLYDISSSLASSISVQAGQGSITSYPYDPTRGNFTLGSSGSILITGLSIDDRPGTSDPETLPLVYNGGSITIDSSQIVLAPGSIVDASGGVYVSPTGAISYGSGGSITLVTGRDLTLPPILGGRLDLLGSLSAYSGATGGSLSITAPQVRIGAPPAGPDSLSLSPDFFNQGGFSSFSIHGLAEPTAAAGISSPGLVVAPGTVIDASALNAFLEPAGIEGDNLILSPILLSQQSRTPVNLNFSASGSVNFLKVPVARGDLIVGAGARIESDPNASSGASITLKGDTVALLGSVIAPGGSITISGATDSRNLFASSPDNTTDALTTVDIGPHAVVSTAGVTVPTANAYGYDTGAVLNGGSISISGNIVAEAGALIDVSGASDTLDRLPLYSSLSPLSFGPINSPALIPTLVQSNAGSITLSGGQSLFCDATLLGRPGGPAAIGGSLNIASGIFVAENQVVTIATPSLIITQSGPTIPDPSFYPAGATAIGYPVLGSNSKPIPGMGYFAASTFENSGMASLSLQGSVQFKGPVDLTAPASLTVATGGFLYADSSVHLTAPYVALGTPFAAPISLAAAQDQYTATGFVPGSPNLYYNPSSGPGKLTVTASLIDIGYLSLQDIGSASFIADNGDIRGDGTLDAAGNIYMRAGQIYPTTESAFNIVSYGGSVTFAASGVRQLPLSAGGSINVYASTIIQDGVLVAPFGQINLGWNGTGTSPLDPLSGAGYETGQNSSGQTIPSIPIAQSVTLGPGSITSVSAVDPYTGIALTIPYGTNNNGTTWIDPAGIDITAGGAPQKSISISGLKVSDAPHSLIDIAGGGDLYAYRFVYSNTGHTDVLASTLGAGQSISSASFAILPGYQAQFAPFGEYNTQESASNAPNFYNPEGIQSDYGYINTKIAAGQQVYLAGGGGLAPGYYTLLPARYALLPGGYLVTPQASSAIPAPSAVTLADGSVETSGYTVNSLDSAQTGQPLYTSFNVASQAVVRNSAEYDDFFGNSFLTLGATRNGQPVPLLPKDGGHLIISALNTLTIAGHLSAGTALDGQNALVDISTENPAGILIQGAGSTASSNGALVLDATALDAFGSTSLLIGGYRTSTGGVESVQVSAAKVEIDNKGSPLTGSDIILAATGSLILDPDAEIDSSGVASGSPLLSVTGDGALVRVSSDPAASVVRTGVDSSSSPTLDIGAGASISGASVTIDSSASVSLDPSASIQGATIALDAGHILLNLDGNAPSTGLVLTPAALSSFAAGAQSLSLLSYSSIDIYGSGAIGAKNKAGQPVLALLALQAGAINGFDNGSVSFAARTIRLDNAADTTIAAGPAQQTGNLEFDASFINLGAPVPGVTAYSPGVDQVNIGQFSTVTLNATSGIFQSASGGLAVGGILTSVPPTVITNLIANAPDISAAQGVTGSITATGAFDLNPAGKTPGPGGAGASLSLEGASLDINSRILAEAGSIKLEAFSGALDVGPTGSISAAGVAQTFFDATRYQSGGQVSLIADQGSVVIEAPAAAGAFAVNVSAPVGGGNAGSVSVSAPDGSFTLNGALAGQAGAGGRGGSFSLDVATLSDIDTLDTALSSTPGSSAGGFDQSLVFRIRTAPLVTISGAAKAALFQLSVDQGAIDLVGSIDASGPTGGQVTLDAFGNITVESTAKISAAGANFNSAGQGGSVSLATTTGQLVIDGEIDLGVTAAPSGPGAYQDQTGTLYLRAPQLGGATPNGIAVNPISGTVNGASSIVVEGFHAFDASSDPVIDDFENAALANASAFMANASSIAGAIWDNNSSFALALISLRPGEEIDNPSGNLTLNNDWNLSTARFGPTAVTTNNHTVGTLPGILTLRALGSIVFNGALTDGFGDSTGAVPADSNGQPAAYKETLLPLLSGGAPQLSWSYNITAGADFSSVDSSQVLPISALAAGAYTGSVQIGSTAGGANISNDGTLTSVIEGNYQVIRTGAGSINIAAALDVQFLNQFAAVYTAGSLVNPTSGLSGPFTTPVLSNGTITKPYPAQYSDHGGSVTITAGRDLIHYYKDINGVLQSNSELETPSSWLYRRGAVGANGQFTATAQKDLASTTWWVDFSNFFEDVGALGGGNVTLIAGRDVSNVDAAIPTNARMPSGTPNASALVELGGGDLTVQAGRDINGGVYYVESGYGSLTAGGSITTNASRSPNSAGTILGQAPDPIQDWLATTLFIGNSSFDVSARGNVNLGPMVNAFLLPPGAGNTVFDKSYFSTYSSASAVDVTSLGGGITLSLEAADPVIGTAPALDIWYSNQFLKQTPGGAPGTAGIQPWLLSNESNPSVLTTGYEILPPTLNLTAFSGSVDLQGNLDLAPSPAGNLTILAAGGINGLRPIGTVSGNEQWLGSVIDVSDSPPSAVPGITTPLSVSTTVKSHNTLSGFFANLTALFNDSGSVIGHYGALDTKEQLHGVSASGGPLHSGDSDPVLLYAAGGSLADLTLFSPKQTRILASQDITDIAFYIQNIVSSDISVISAGRDITAYDPQSPLRVTAISAGNQLASASITPMVGDIQVAGPGTVEVLAGRNLTLGNGASNADGTGTGLTTIGNNANPLLPFNGASIVAAAGLGSASPGLGDASSLDITSFVSSVLEGPDSARYFADLLSVDPTTGATSLDQFNKLNPQQKALAALDIFFLALRDAGRDHNLPGSPGSGNYDAGDAAIAALFSRGPYSGDMDITGRDINTQSGGDIDLLAPGGQLTVGTDIAADQPDQGILTEDGGNISIFTNGDVNLGISRIFTLRGGNIVIWSSQGNIAAGASSKTVQSTPPNRALVDPASGDISIDLAGPATGGGIGVLATVIGVAPGSVDLIAPAGIIDAGDAGIRATGNLNLAATQIVNASNIQAGGASSGVPTVTVAAPNIGAIAASSAAVGATQASATQQNNNQSQNQTAGNSEPSIIDVQVLGYGGGEGDAEGG